MEALIKQQLIRKVLTQATLTSSVAADPGVPVVPRKWLAFCLTEATGDQFSLPVVNLIFRRFCRTLSKDTVAVRSNHGSKWLRIEYLERFVDFALTFAEHVDDIRVYARYWANRKQNLKGDKMDSPVEAVYKANHERGLYGGLIMGGTYARNLALQQSALHFEEALRHGEATLVLGSTNYTDCLGGDADCLGGGTDD